jgi:hypothetical protein
VLAYSNDNFEAIVAKLPVRLGPVRRGRLRRDLEAAAPLFEMRRLPRLRPAAAIRYYLCPLEVALRRGWVDRAKVKLDAIQNDRRGRSARFFLSGASVDATLACDPPDPPRPGNQDYRAVIGALLDAGALAAALAIVEAAIRDAEAYKNPDPHRVADREKTMFVMALDRAFKAATGCPPSRKRRSKRDETPTPFEGFLAECVRPLLKPGHHPDFEDWAERLALRWAREQERLDSMIDKAAQKLKARKLKALGQ